MGATRRRANEECGGQNEDGFDSCLLRGRSFLQQSKHKLIEPRQLKGGGLAAEGSAVLR
jgi:hypothetical protein